MMNCEYMDGRSRQIRCFDKLERLTERQILEFQDLVLANGVHYVDVDSFADARRFVSSFLGSLTPSKRVACLTTNGDSLDSQVIRLYDDLAFAGSLANSPITLESFLLEEFYYDFVWVECTPELLVTPWFWYFEKKLSDFNLGATSPVIIFYVRNF